MSLILTAIGLNAAVGTNFTTVNCLRFHCFYIENLKVIHILAQLPLGLDSLDLQVQIELKKVRNQQRVLVSDDRIFNV